MAHSTGRSQLSSDEESDLVPLLKSLNHRIATLGVRVAEKLFPRETSRLQTQRQRLLDAPLFGSPEKHFFSTVQINISPLDKTDLSSLGYGGRSHVDRHDDPMSLTLLICISSLNQASDPGKFYFGETRDWCTLYPFSLIIFRGTSRHGATQAVSRRKANASEKRINLVLYPRKEFVNRTLPILYPCSPTNQLADYSFFCDEEACFGTEVYYKA